MLLNFLYHFTPQEKYPHQELPGLKTRRWLFIFETSETLEKNTPVTEHGDGKAHKKGAKRDKINGGM
jgi:hypothetical protein